MIPIFGARDGDPGADWHTTWADGADHAVDGAQSDRAQSGGAQSDRAQSDAQSGDEASVAAELDLEGERDAAERELLKRLRAKQLSSSEARSLVAERGLPRAQVEAVVDVFLRRGYLDDARLAEQLVHVGVERRHQGRAVIAQTLARRGIPRGLAEAALSVLSDEEEDRALDFARTKVRSVGGRDRDAAMRRLVGQLSRRGYSGEIAFASARRALDEFSAGDGEG